MTMSLYYELTFDPDRPTSAGTGVARAFVGDESKHIIQNCDHYFGSGRCLGARALAALGLALYGVWTLS